jgi:predicted nucleic acid-binding protein
VRTALDTNILSALWSREPSAAGIAKSIGEAKQAGAVLISGVVYAEILAYPKATEAFVAEFCAQTGVVKDFRFQDAVWIEAGRRFARYASRRRQAGGGGPKRLLADFLIGSHALLQADRLMTLDPDRYRQDFPELLLYEVGECG